MTTVAQSQHTVSCDDVRRSRQLAAIIVLLPLSPNLGADVAGYLTARRRAYDGSASCSNSFVCLPHVPCPSPRLAARNGSGGNSCQLCRSQLSIACPQKCGLLCLGAHRHVNVTDTNIKIIKHIDTDYIEALSEDFGQDSDSRRRRR